MFGVQTLRRHQGKSLSPREVAASFAKAMALAREFPELDPKQLLQPAILRMQVR